MGHVSIGLTIYGLLQVVNLISGPCCQFQLMVYLARLWDHDLDFLGPLDFIGHRNVWFPICDSLKPLFYFAWLPRYYVSNIFSLKMHWAPLLCLGDYSIFQLWTYSGSRDTLSKPLTAKSVYGPSYCSFRTFPSKMRYGWKLGQNGEGVITQTNLFLVFRHQMTVQNFTIFE